MALEPNLCTCEPPPVGNARCDKCGRTRTKPRPSNKKTKASATARAKAKAAWQTGRTGRDIPQRAHRRAG